MDDEIVVGINVKPDTTKENSKKEKKKKKKKAKKVNKKQKTNEKKPGNKSQKEKLKKKPVIRTQNSAQKYHNQKVIKRLVITLLTIVALLIILSSSLFNIRKITVSGNNKLTSDTIISLSKLELYSNIFRFNTLVTENNIKENAYVEDVKISRRIPDTVKIDIKERNANFSLKFAESYAYINNQGYILEFNIENQDIPVITGYKTDLSLLKTGERIILDDLKKMEIVIKICDVLKNNDMENLVSKIDISDEKNYVVTLGNDEKIVYIGDGSDLNTRALYLKAILDATNGQNGEIFLNVDLNSDNPYFRPSTN